MSYFIIGGTNFMVGQMSYFIIGGTNVMVGQMSFFIIGGTNVMMGQMSYVIIGGTNVGVGQMSLCCYRWDKCQGGTNVRWDKRQWDKRRWHLCRWDKSRATLKMVKFILKKYRGSEEKKELFQLKMVRTFEYLGTAQAVPLTVWTNCPSVILMLRRLKKLKQYNNQLSLRNI